MFRDLFSANPANTLAVAGLLFFIALFAAVLVWTGSKKRAAHYARMARLPVDDAAARGGELP